MQASFFERLRSQGMPGRWLLLTVCLLVIASVLAGAPIRAQSSAPATISDALLAKAQQEGKVRVIVGLKGAWQPESKLSGVQAVQAQRHGIEKAQDALLQTLSESTAGAVRRFSTLPYLAMDVDAAALSALAADPAVSLVVEDRPSPPMLKESVPLIKADKAWDSGFSGAGYSIAVVDSGVDATHPFLKGRVTGEACFSTNSWDSLSMCPSGDDQQVGPGAGQNCPMSIEGCEHGTHVAGIAAGNGPEFSGVAKDAGIIVLQVFSLFNCGTEDFFEPCILSYPSDQVAALDYIYNLRASHNIAAVNMSLGNTDYYSTALACNNASGNALIKLAIENLRAAGIATVVASGNEGKTSQLGVPACLSSAISVGATTKSNTVASYSNSASWLSLLAPGSGIVSSVPGGGYGTMSGTSMAAPHVAGAWAVLKSRAPGASVDQILLALRSTGVPVTDTRNSLVHRRIDVAAALATFPQLDEKIFAPMVRR